MIHAMIRLTCGYHHMIYGKAEVPEFTIPLGRDVQIPNNLMFYKTSEDERLYHIERYFCGDGIVDPTWKSLDGSDVLLYPIAIKRVHVITGKQECFLFVNGIRELFKKFPITFNPNVESIGSNILTKYGITMKNSNFQKIISRLTPLFPSYRRGTTLEGDTDREFYYSLRSEHTEDMEAELTSRISMDPTTLDSITKLLLDRHCIASSELESHVSCIYTSDLYNDVLAANSANASNYGVFTKTETRNTKAMVEDLPNILYYLFMLDSNQIVLISDLNFDTIKPNQIGDTVQYFKESFETPMYPPIKDSVKGLTRSGPWIRTFIGEETSNNKTSSFVINKQWIEVVSIAYTIRNTDKSCKIDLVPWLLTSTSLLNV